MSVRESAHTTEISDGTEVVVLRRRRLRLDVKKGLDRRTRVELEIDRIVIGTHPTCHLVLRDPTVSRTHCEIALVDAGYQLSDLDSTNGTYIDKMRVGQVVSAGAVTFRVGETTIAMTPTDQTVDIELPEETSFGPLLGRSAKMRQVFELLGKVSPTDATVLITGESGTGKELAARAIHESSPRAGGPFVVVDCGAMPANLIESELYGHVRGAFTGAERARVGAFEAASGGTLFLDELGELPLDLQPRLLGAIERRAVQPLGTSEMRPVDVRIVAATNRDLRREVNRKSFREDLYFRLAVVTVEMPPLRDRPEDIPLYVRDFLAEEATVRPSFTIDNPTMQRLAAQPWRGNVRELRNVLERAAALGSVDLPETHPSAAAPAGGAGGGAGIVDVNVPFKVGKAALIEGYEREYITRLMAAHDKNITRAARSAEIDRVYLLRLLDKYGLRPKR